MSDEFNIIGRVKVVKTFKGIDNQGFESIVFIFKEEPNFQLKTSKITSRIVARSGQYRLFISLMDDNETSSEIFEVFTEDLLRSIETAKNEQQVLEILANRFLYWSDLFKRDREIMDEKWVRGFIGELWFLSNILSEKLGVDVAVRSWTGPDKANQDFITENMIYEIKTVSQQNNTIKISNNNQLSKDMFLVVVVLSKTSDVSHSSVNLSKLIQYIYGKINNPNTHVLFNQKLLEIGLFPTNEVRIYDRFSYNIEELKYYKINDEFPIIDHAKVPNAISKYSYELLISDIKKYIVSEDIIWK